MDDRITRLLHAYAHCIDDERYEDWPDFFTDDGRYQVITREAHRAGQPVGLLLCRNKGMMKDRVYSMRNANIFAPHHYRHLLSAPFVKGEVDGLVELQTGFGLVRIMEGGTPELFLSGCYLDRIATNGEACRFRERIVVLDSSRVDTLIVAPI